MLRERLAGLVRARGGDAAAAARGAVATWWSGCGRNSPPPAFLRDLFASRRRLGRRPATPSPPRRWRRSAGPAPTGSLRRSGRPPTCRCWTRSKPPQRRRPGGTRHVVVDEAQDLSPMQLRSVARRCATGSLTLVGDLAQSTGPWARDSWQEVTATCRRAPGYGRPLRYGYRVPRQVYAAGGRVAAGGRTRGHPPTVVRDGPAGPGDPPGCRWRSGRVGWCRWRPVTPPKVSSSGIVCPQRCRREIEAALDAVTDVAWSSAERGELGTAINLVSPQEAKGLEFDAVVVVEPEAIVAEDERGHRLLYVALTRTTRRLDIVCVGEPVPLPAPVLALSPGGPEPDRFDRARASRRLAEHLAGRVRAAAPANAWPRVLAHLEATDRVGRLRGRAQNRGGARAADRLRRRAAGRSSTGRSR